MVHLWIDMLGMGSSLILLCFEFEIRLYLLEWTAKGFPELLKSRELRALLERRLYNVRCPVLNQAQLMG